MGTIISQLKIGTVISVSSTKLEVMNKQATVSRLNIMSIPLSLFCTTADGRRYAFFGDEIDECISIVSQPS